MLYHRIKWPTKIFSPAIIVRRKHVVETAETATSSTARRFVLYHAGNVVDLRAAMVSMRATDVLPDK